MNPMPDEESIEALLRQSFDGAVADAGFTDRLMQRVPPRRRFTLWPLLVSVVAGIALCWLSLAGSPLLRAAWQGWLSGHWSTSSWVTLVAIGLFSLCALGWALSEADAR